MKNSVSATPSTSFLPYKPFKTLFDNGHQYHVSNDAVTHLRQFIETITLKIVQLTIAEFEEYNQRRKEQGLPALRRINQYAVDKAIKTYNYTGRIENYGLQSSEIASHGGNNMSTETDATKSAKMENVGKREQ